MMENGLKSYKNYSNVMLCESIPVSLILAKILFIQSQTVF